MNESRHGERLPVTRKVARERADPRGDNEISVTEIVSARERRGAPRSTRLANDRERFAARDAT